MSNEQPAATKRKIIFFLLEDRWLLVIRWCKMGANQLDAKNKLPKITPFAKAHTFPHLATRTRTFSARRKPWILKIKRDSHKHTDFFVLSRVACTARERRMSNVCAIMIRPYDCPLEIWHWTAMHLSTLNTQTTRFEQKKTLTKHALFWPNAFDCDYVFRVNARACENYCCLLMTDASMGYEYCTTCKPGKWHTLTAEWAKRARQRECVCDERAWGIHRNCNTDLFVNYFVVVISNAPNEWNLLYATSTEKCQTKHSRFAI